MSCKRAADGILTDVKSAGGLVGLIGSRTSRHISEKLAMPPLIIVHDIWNDERAPQR
jgi:hypothetical protein